MLREYGVDIAQGDRLGRPVNADRGLAAYAGGAQRLNRRARRVRMLTAATIAFSWPEPCDGRTPSWRASCMPFM